MQRSLYAYKIEIQPVSEKRKVEMPDFEKDFIEAIKILCGKKAIERKKDFAKDKKVVYLDRFEYNDEAGIVNLKFISAKYDARRRVIDTKTMRGKGILKTVGDGDEEKNHVCIKFVGNGKAVCLFEYNYYGIGFAKIMNYLQGKIKEYHRGKKDGCYYNLVYENIVSNDFLESLAQLSKVNAVTLTVDQEDVKVSDFKTLSGKQDLSRDVDIMLKPAATGIGIKKDTVKEFFKIYNNANMKVKTVTVRGDGSEKQALSFDTEQMKKKIVIHVDSTSDTGEVSTRNIFDILFTEILPL